MTTPREPQPSVNPEKAQDSTDDPARVAETQIYRPAAAPEGPAIPAARPSDAGIPQFTPPGGYPSYPATDVPPAPPSYPTYSRQPETAYPQPGYQQLPGAPRLQPGYPPQHGYPPQPGYPQGGYPQQYGVPVYQPYSSYGQPAAPVQAWSIASFVCLGLTAASFLLCVVPVIVTAPTGLILGLVGHAKGEPLGKWAAIVNGVVLALAIVLVVAFVGIMGINRT
ncbi:hypothetical protein [Nocardia sp. NPDC005366]|uniref:hypothetical protein n=1 Tax=Nocardia sp. NPDC005366 TaxID=3156878 RepID=UPI0033B943D9